MSDLPISLLPAHSSVRHAQVTHVHVLDVCDVHVLVVFDALLVGFHN